MMPSNHLILCCPLLLLSAIFPSIFSNELALHIRWLKHYSFSFSISPSSEYPGLISFRIDWFDLLAVQGTLKSLLQHHNSKALILWRLAFFVVQLSHLSMTTGKTIPSTIWTFVIKVMSLLCNTLSRFVIAFLPRSRHLLISWLLSPSAVILEPKEKKYPTVSIVFPSICHEVMGLYVMIFVFWMLNFKLAFSLSSFAFIKRLFSSSPVSAPSMVSSACMRLTTCHKMNHIFDLQSTKHSHVYCIIWFLVTTLTNRFANSLIQPLSTVTYRYWAYRYGLMGWKTNQPPKKPHVNR